MITCNKPTLRFHGCNGANSKKKAEIDMINFFRCIDILMAKWILKACKLDMFNLYFFFFLKFRLSNFQSYSH